MHATDGVDAEVSLLREEADLSELLGLWTTVFDQPESIFLGVWRATPPSRRRTAVARVDGRLVASVQLYVLPLRDESGVPGPVGCVANVSTLPAFRGRGFSSKLLAMALEEMEALGCGWSYLFTGIAPFYERLGWKPVSKTTLQGFPNAAEPLPVIGAADLPKVREIYETAGANTPLSMARGDGDWAEKVPVRLPGTWTGWLHSDGYAAGRAAEGTFTVDEWFVRDDAPEGYARLLEAMAADGPERGFSNVVVAGTLGPAARTALASLGEWQPESPEAGMVRPVAPDWSHDRLAALFARDDARFSILDCF